MQPQRAILHAVRARLTRSSTQEDPRKYDREVKEGDPVKQKNDFRSYVGFASPFKQIPISFCGNSTHPLTFTIFACEVGRLSGFCGSVFFSLFGGRRWVPVEISTLVAASFDQAPICSFLRGAWEPGTA